MVDRGDSTPSPIRWDPQQKMYIQVNSTQHATQLDEINNQINEHINEQDEYDNYLINEINDYDIVTSIPLIWDPEQKKYIEIENLKDAINLDALNDTLESYEKEESKYAEYCEKLTKDYDLNHLKNLIENISNKNISNLK